MKKHRIERRILWGDLDPLGIVFYPRYYEWMDGAAHLFFEALDLEMGELGRRRSLLFGLVQTGCRYHRPGRYLQRVAIVTRLAELGAKTLVLTHRIEDAESGALMVEGREERICLDVSDPDRLRAVAFPEDIAAVLEAAVS